MYSWEADTSKWYGDGTYRYGAKGAVKRKAAAERAKAHGPRTYEGASGPNEAIIDPKKHVRSTSANPLIVAVDVTGSMANWPLEIFDRLPLLYNTLSQYREDLEICFIAIGDAGYDRWPWWDPSKRDEYREPVPVRVPRKVRWAGGEPEWDDGEWGLI